MSDSTKSVLIVDDQADERAIQRALLEHVGYRVREAPDGEAAVEMALESCPDLVLLDIAMPRMDGFAVCERLRGDPRTESVTILFLTATPDPDIEKRVRAAGASGVLIKPVDPHDVATAVQGLIGTPDA